MLLFCFAALGFSASADQSNFADSLKAGEDSGFLTIVTPDFGRMPDGLRRNQSPCGTVNCNTSNNRPMNQTAPGADFINRDFVASLEITRTSTGNDLIWFGFGDGSTESTFNEPDNAIQFRIHAGGLVGNRIDLVSTLNGSWTSGGFGDGGFFPGSTTEFFIERAGDSVTVSIPALGKSKTMTISGDLNGVLNASNSRLFFGNTSVGTVFSNFRVASAPIGEEVPPLPPVLPPDADGDGTPDSQDVCPLDADNDADGDGLCADVDACPLDASNDIDGDGQCANVDICPLDANNDVDGDGLCGDVDNCPINANGDQADWDGDGTGDACDADDDNDGVPDTNDDCGTTAGGALVNDSGCAIDDLCSCEGTRNHGNYVSCVTRAATVLRKQGYIDNRDKSALVKDAAKSSCGKK